jgi:rhodanese-related sulfurtransferase
MMMSIVIAICVFLPPFFLSQRPRIRAHFMCSPLNALKSFCLFVVFASAATSGANEKSGPKVPQEDPRMVVLSEADSGSTLCGISSLYICASALGSHIAPSDLIDPKYVGSIEGSSAAELVKAAKDNDLHAELFTNLTIRNLNQINSPAILHVRSSSGNPKFNHWLAYLGGDNRKVRIVDAPDRLREVSAAQALALWDGTAIVLSLEGTSRRFVYQNLLDMCLWAGLLVAIIGLHGHLAQTVAIRSHNRVFLALGSICSLACGLVVVRHVISDDGFCNNTDAIAEISRRYYSHAFTELSPKEFARALSSEDPPLLIDARWPTDFEKGAIPGAVSISIGSSMPQRQEVLASVPKPKSIIVYCQSANCGYADQIAQFLYYNGYESTMIYRPGYAHWQLQEAAEPSRGTAHKLVNRDKD